jgi:hypothetical protein
MMATAEKTAAAIPSLGVQETINNIRELNARLIESSKTAGRVALDAYESTLKSMVGFHSHIAGASQLDWVSALAATHAQFIRDVSADFINAAHDTLT